MNLDELIMRINKSAEDLDYTSTRKYIEENMDTLKKNKIRLKGNARELLDFLTNRRDSGLDQLTRKDMLVISAINTNATNFDLRGIKNIVNNNPSLLLRKDILDYLNADAKLLLEGIGAIKNK